MPHVTSELPLGTLLVIVTIIGIAVRLSYRLGALHTTLRHHAERMERYEARNQQIAADLQKIIGRIEDPTKSPWPKNRRLTERTQ